MSQTTELSEARQRLLEKYMRGALSQTSSNEATIAHRTSTGPVPLSFGQQQVWLLDQLMPNIPVYNECVTIHLPGPLDVPALEQSFNEIIRRYEAWRTSFPLVDGLPVQRIHPPTTISLPVIDVRHIPEAEREAEALRLATEDARVPFDLAQGPLLRARLIRLGDQEHRLFLTLHHIIFDGVAIYQVFLPELRTLYEAVLSGKPSPLPDPPLQYTDYAYWQREQVRGDMLAKQLAFWRQHLAGAPAALELPTDHPRPPVQTYSGSMQPFAISKRLTDDLKALGLREGVTLYMVLVAAFKTLLYRYTGQEDMLIGTATAGRNREEFQKMMGFFLNTLVLRTDLSGNPTFRELLWRVREEILSAVAHEDVPFEYLVKELQPERNLAQNPLFQVLLTLEPPLPVLPSGWTLTQMDVTVGTSKFDLSLELDDRPEGLIGRFEYNTDLFDEVTIKRMIGHWKMLLEGIVADVGQRLTELPLLTEAESHQLLIEWNTTQIAYPKDQCIHQLFETQVERTPEAVAVVFEDEQLTYRELNRRANQLAHYLHYLGVGPDVLVGLCVERSLDMVVGLLGILKAGGAYVPLDPAFPSERIAFMLEDAQAPVLVTQQHLTENLPTQRARVVCLDTDRAMLAQQRETNLPPIGTSADLAYVIYTSGSTGRPKGVQIIHHAVVNFLLSMREQPGLTAEDTLLAITTLAFDIAALELFLPLIVGARLIVASRDVAVDGTALIETLARTHTTVMQATPVTWHILLAAGWQGKRDLKILCGGEALPRELAQELLPKSASLWNLYGPTETTIWSSTCQIQPQDEVIPIGSPIANTQIYILDAHLQPVPIGVSGELFIGGDGLARGYLQRPELTAERFIAHPFSDEPGARLYRTGDLARYRSNGPLEHQGRLDFQVKLRGFRIELGEIEAVLSQHPAVRQAVVVAREDVPGDKRLVAYIVLYEGQAIITDDLKSHVMKQVPAYMVPSAFVLLETLPLTPNGKIDRRALPAPEMSASPAKRTFVAPTLPLHQQLVQIWEDLLGVRPIGIRDDFFDLGGHSLLAARMVNQIAQVCGKKLPLSTLFAGATIEHLTTALMEDAKPGSRTPLVAVQVDGARRPFFYLHGDWRGGAFYCTPLARALGTDQPFYALEPYALDSMRVPPALETIAAAHIELLRSVQPEGPYQLGGWCNGALVAYEMAWQLHKQGQSVDLLILMDGIIPGRHRQLRSIISRLGGLLHMSQEKQLDWFVLVHHVYRYLRFPRYRQLRNSEQMRTAGQGEGGYRRGKVSFRLPLLSELFTTAETLRQHYPNVFEWVTAGYTPGLYPGKITFFWAREESGLLAEWYKVLRAKEGEVDIHFIPGNDLTSRTRHLPVLAEQLRACLSATQMSGSNK